MTDPAGGRSQPLGRQRVAILVVLLGLAAAGWVVVVGQSGGNEMDRHMMGVPDLTMGSGSLFFTMWVAMMVAMMFPTSAPMVLAYGRMQRSRPINTSLFVASYIAIWIAFGAAAFALGAGAEAAAERSEWVAEHWGRGGGILLVLAGLYQLSPLKELCLRKCRTPLSFIMHEWRPGAYGALRMGLAYGLYCFGCCWLLFVILVPLGVMNLAAMLVVAAIVFAEKAMPWGRQIGRVAAAGRRQLGGVLVVEELGEWFGPGWDVAVQDRVPARSIGPVPFDEPWRKIRIIRSRCRWVFLASVGPRDPGWAARHPVASVPPTCPQLAQEIHRAIHRSGGIASLFAGTRRWVTGGERGQGGVRGARRGAACGPVD